MSDRTIQTTVAGSSGRQAAYVLLAFLLLSLLVFREVIPPGNILFTTDDNVGQIAAGKDRMPGSWLGGWQDKELMGYPAPAYVGSTNLLLLLLPPVFFNNWINAFDVVMGSFFLILFLRQRGLGWAPCALGALTVYWVGSNFTLVYAGHIGKFGIIMWAAIYLWLVEKAVHTRALPYAVLAGGAMGAMFLEQADVALFFSLALGPYAIHAFVRRYGWSWLPLARTLAPLVVVAFLLAFHPIWTGYQTAVVGVAAVQADDPAEQWEYVTQWSWPPEESIDFIAPGFTGWRSGEPAGPYVGRMGRSAGWEETGRGFRNFKLENQYIGSIPVAFAFLAGMIAWRRRRSGEAFHGDTRFWSVVLVLALLLSFGKYFPLYALFYQLPVVSSIRNPNKFLQVFQWALGLMAAYGLHHVLRGTGSIRGQPVPDAVVKPFAMVCAVIAGLLLVWMLASLAAWDVLTDRFAQEGWGAWAETIAGNRIRALGHAAVMTGIAAAGIYVLSFMRSRLGNAFPYIAWGVVFLVVFDVWFLARHYVQTMPARMLDRHEIVQVLKTAPHHRVALISQEGFYNQWLTYLFPYHGIKTINVAQMPRMPDDYQVYLNEVGRNLVRLWELGAVRFVLGPAELWSQIQGDAQLRDKFELVKAYNIVEENGAPVVRIGTGEEPGRHIVLRMTSRTPRFAVVGGWEVAEDIQALRRHARQQIPALDRVMVAPEWADDLPSSTDSGDVGAVRVHAYRPGYMHLSVSSEALSILRIAEKYDPHWKATVDGYPTPVRRVDYISQGIFLTEGQHDVILRYAPPRGSFLVQIAGLLVCVAALTGLVRARSNGRAAE